MKNLKMIIVYGILIILFVAGFAGYFFNNKNEDVATTAKSHLHQPRLSVKDKVKLSEKKPNSNPVVGIYRSKNYSKATNTAIKNAGGLNKIIKKDDTVLIKPNLGAWGIAGESADDTDYRVVQEIANIAKKLGAKRIIVAEGSYSGNMFKDLGYKKIKGVELIDLNKFGKEDCYRIKPKNSLTGETFYIPKVYMDADVVISAAKLKTYNLVGVTLSLKNAFGVPPAGLYGSIGGKVKLHDLGVEKSIVDLNKIRKPDFAVIDGIIGGKGAGPADDTPVNSNIIIAGKDLVATDTVGLNFMSFKLDEVPYVKLAAKEGLGICDLKRIKVVGADLNYIKMDFKNLE